LKQEMQNLKSFHRQVRPALSIFPQPDLMMKNYHVELLQMRSQ
jgi:hypothetical protein